MGEKLIEVLFPICDDDVRSVRELFGVEENDIRTNIGLIREWLKKQPHLPGDDSDDRLERFLLRNKFRVEQTKQKLEKYYTLKGINKTYFEDMDPLGEVMQNNRKCFMYVPIPKLTPKHERVFIFKATGNDHLYDFGRMMLDCLVLLDMQLSYDYPYGERMILDFDGFNMTHFKTMTISTFSMTYNLHQEAFSGRLVGIEIYNAPPFKNMLLALMKTVFKKKVYEKISIHETLESLQNNVPKECLPEEYGGYLGPMVAFHDKVGELFLEKREFILKSAKRVAHESLRIGEVRQDQMFGVEGSFKKINLD